MDKESKERRQEVEGMERGLEGGMKEKKKSKYVWKELKKPYFEKSDQITFWSNCLSQYIKQSFFGFF